MNAHGAYLAIARHKLRAASTSLSKVRAMPHVTQETLRYFEAGVGVALDALHDVQEDFTASKRHFA